jgi:hypothetical protein
MGILINFYGFSPPPPHPENPQYSGQAIIWVLGKILKISKYLVWARPFLPIKKSSQLLKNFQ